MTYQQPYYQPPPQKRSSATWWIIGGCGVVLVLAALCVCGLFILGGAALLSVEPSAPVISHVTPTPAPGQPTAEAAQPTSTPEPTVPLEPTNTPQPTATPLPLGETVSFADWDYMVTEANIMRTIGDKSPRGVYVLALVQVTNQGVTERSIGSDFFVARDAQGRLYAMDGDASLEHHHVHDTAHWHLDNIGPTLTGIIPVVFDVSPDASNVLLQTAGVNEPTILLVENVGGAPLAVPGEPLSAADWAYVITDVSTAGTIGSMVARGQYVAIILTVRNDSLSPRELGSDFFVLKDGEGRTYEMDSDASLEYHNALDTDAWHLETLGPSLVGTVPVVFDVSPDATNLALHAKRGDAEPVLVLDAVGGQPIELAGEAHTAGNWEFAIQEVSTLSSIGDEIAEGQFLVVILQVKNLAPTQQDIGSKMSTLKDAQGRTYELDTDASLEYHHTFDTDAWHLESIGPSLKGTVPLVFDVATDASGFVLVTQEGAEVSLQ